MMNEEMKKAMAGKAMPELAIVDNNTLAVFSIAIHKWFIAKIAAIFESRMPDSLN